MMIVATALLLFTGQIGRLPNPAERTAVTALVHAELKDPSSAQFQWLPIAKSGIYCGRVNAKNSYGGYTGFRPFVVFWNEATGLRKPLPGALVASDSDNAMTDVIQQQCSSAGYKV